METCTFGLEAGMGKPIAERRQGVPYRAYCFCTARKKGTRFPVSARSIVFRSSISPERMERNCRVSPCFVVKNPFRSCSPRSLVSIRRLRRKSSMTITRNSPMTKRNNTMSILEKTVKVTPKKRRKMTPKS